MAYIRTHETTQRARGKVVETYAAVWRANVNGKVRLRQRSFPTREAAEDYLPTAYAAERTTHTTDPAEIRHRSERTLSGYADGWLAAQRLKTSTGQLKRSTLDGYGQLLRAYALPKLGHLPIASISAADVERALSELIGQRTRQGSGPRSIRHVWNTLRRMFIYAMQHDAIVSNPLDRVASQRIRRPAIGNCSRRTRWLPRRSPS